jgi:hypothetical protein
MSSSGAAEGVGDIAWLFVNVPDGFPRSVTNVMPRGIAGGKISKHSIGCAWFGDFLGTFAGLLVAFQE